MQETVHPRALSADSILKERAKVRQEKNLKEPYRELEEFHNRLKEKIDSETTRLMSKKPGKTKQQCVKDIRDTLGFPYKYFSRVYNADVRTHKFKKDDAVFWSMFLATDLADFYSLMRQSGNDIEKSIEIDDCKICCIIEDRFDDAGADYFSKCVKLKGVIKERKLTDLFPRIKDKEK